MVDWNIGTVHKFPMLRVEILEPNVPSIEFIIDTAFDGELSVPPPVAALFGRPPDDFQTIKLADGREVRCPFYEVDIRWDDEIRRVIVLVLDGNPLLGVELMEGYRLTADFVQDGDVYLEPA